MLDSGFFAKLETMARYLREDRRPFGGIQLVICGDFFQLPPVSKFGPPSFAFMCPEWSQCVQRTQEGLRVEI